MIKLEQKGDFSKTSGFFKKIKYRSYIDILNDCGQRGVEALSKATPVDTGKTAASWEYRIKESSNGIVKIEFWNTNIQNGVPVAIVLQYGHVTGSGGWVEGRDYINPALRPIFDEMTKRVWKEVSEF